jgi:hypothetical protein
MEQYANEASTIVDSSYTAGGASLTVVSTAAPFPQSPNFSITIFDAATGLVKSILKVTAVTNGTTWAVTSAEGIDANCVTGDVVRLCLTARAMDEIRKDMVQYGTRAGLPGSPYTGQRAGNMYLCSDSPYEYYFNGTVWVPRYKGMEVSEPGLTTSPSFSWVNQGTATEETAAGGLRMVCPTSSGDNVRGRYIGQPSRPYTITALFKIQAVQANFFNSGLGFYNTSSGRFIMMGFSNLADGGLIQIQKFNSTTSFNGTYTAVTVTANDEIWIRVTDNGTNFIFSFSTNGFDWTQVDSRSRTDFITPDQVGWFMDAANSTYPASLWLLHWKQT